MNIERLRALYPNLSENELEMAKQNLERFVAFIAEICEIQEEQSRQQPDESALPFDRDLVQQ